jgi:hydroxymethylpyrimidine/phosphomethylpyrimidine kinase
MLASPDTIAALATYLRTLETRPFLVLDPVMISTSGHELLATSARDALLSDLLPLVDLVTPNIPEAGVLLGTDTAPKTLADVVALARRLHPLLKGPALLLKGGHLPVSQASVEAFIEKEGMAAMWLAAPPIAVIDDYRSTLGLAPERADVVVDLLVEDGGITVFVGPCVDTSSTHGTGCTLSAALASCYALEAGVKINGTNGARRISHDAVRRAIAYTQTAIASAPKLGRGNGPLNHAHCVAPRTIPA